MSKRKAPSVTELSTKAMKPSRNERLELTMAISNIASIEDKFIAAVNHMKELGPGVLRSLDLQIEAKKHEVEELEEEFKNRRKDGQIRTDQQIAEYKYDAAMEILKERDEEAICSTELQKLTDSLDQLKADRTAELEQVRKEERETAAQKLAAATRNADLVHKAEIAEKAASVTQQAKEIASLQAAIENLRHELSEQRKLTKEVAEAARSAPIHLSNGTGK